MQTQSLVHAAISLADASYPEYPSRETAGLILLEYGLGADELTVNDVLREAREFIREWRSEAIRDFADAAAHDC